MGVKQMKKIKCLFIVICGLCILFTACDPTDTSTPSQTTLVTTTVSETTVETTTEEESTRNDDAYQRGTYRERYQSMSKHFAELVGRDEYLSWENDLMEELEKGNEAVMNECVAVAYVKHFNVRKEDFTKANEELKAFFMKFPNYDPTDPNYEVYPVDLIYTFDDEKINEYFRWENWPYDGWWSEGLE
jgi:TolA-binding protein